MVTPEDKAFVERLLSEDTTVENMEILDEKLKNKAFAQYYKNQLDLNYCDKGWKVFINYAPMIIFVILIIVGLYLLIKKQ